MANFNYNEKQALINLNILPSQFEEEDYYRLAEILSTEEPGERMMTGREFADKYNEGGN